MIKGETVVLFERIISSYDEFGAPVFTEVETSVENVIVGNPSTDDMVSDLNLYGKSLLFVLGIPKGDNHIWKDRVVKIRGEKFRTYGFPLVQMKENVPGRWNTQVKVERYE